MEDQSKQFFELVEYAILCETELEEHAPLCGLTLAQVKNLNVLVKKAAVMYFLGFVPNYRSLREKRWNVIFAITASLIGFGVDCLVPGVPVGTWSLAFIIANFLPDVKKEDIDKEIDQAAVELGFANQTENIIAKTVERFFKGDSEAFKKAYKEIVSHPRSKRYVTYLLAAMEKYPYKQARLIAKKLA